MYELRYSKRTKVDYPGMLNKNIKKIMELISKQNTLLQENKSLEERIKNVIKIYEICNINFDLFFEQKKFLRLTYYKTFELLKTAVNENGESSVLKKVLKRYRNKYEEYRMREWGVWKIYLPLEIVNHIDGYL